MYLRIYPSVFALWSLTVPIQALNLKLEDDASLITAARTVASQLNSLYKGTEPGQIPGIFGGISSNDNDYLSWWISGAAWSGLVDYRAYSGDDQYTSTVQQAITNQLGPSIDFMPPNQTKTEGNDDQASWGLAAMNAAEKQYPKDPSGPEWIDVAKTVFDRQAARWDDKTCGGGLRWQIFAFNNGYDYKNAVSQGMFFQLAARLAQSTKNETYTDWANKVWDWTTKTGLIDEDFKVLDGTQVATNCQQINRIQWSFNAATFTYGSAILFNHTNGNTTWEDRTKSMLTAMKVFWPKNILTEVACEQSGTCQADQMMMKGLTAQWLGQTAQAAPFVKDSILPVLRASASGAAKQCSDGNDTATCGFSWTSNKSDGRTGVAQQVDAMNVFLANLAGKGVSTTQDNTTQTGATGTSQGSSQSPSTTLAQQTTTPTSDAPRGVLPVSFLALLVVVLLFSVYA